MSNGITMRSGAVVGANGRTKRFPVASAIKACIHEAKSAGVVAPRVRCHKTK